ncbi:MAG: AraC family transcriptional regulator [Bacteroidetes bacterium]|nr:MAG: AraC family transcriptional regulator [Bacteroidota bacterium]
MKPVLEQVAVGRENSILAFRYSRRHFDAPWHFHPQHELTYIEASTGTKFIGDYVGTYSPGELVLLRANLPHCWKNHAQPGSRSVSTVIQWEKGIFARIPELRPVFELLRAAGRGLLFDREAATGIIPLVRHLPELKGHGLYLKLLEVLLQLTNCSYRPLSDTNFPDDLPSEYSSRMARIQEFVAANYQRKIYLGELAALVNMSESSFSRFFSKMMGRPFFRFLNEYRIHLARRMLIETDWSVAEVGYACGYESLPFFHKQFRKLMGMTPAAYRKQYPGMHIISELRNAQT